MGRNHALATALAGLALLAGAGCGSGEEIDPDQLANDLAGNIRDSDVGELSDADCIERGENVYRCIGNFTPSLAIIREQNGPALDQLDAGTIDELRDAGSGPTTWEVTVDPEDGTFI